MSEQSPLELAEGDPFGPHNLPYGVFSTPDRPTDRRVGVRIGDHVLDAGAAAHALGGPYAALLAKPSLNPLLAAGRHGLARCAPGAHRLGDRAGPPPGLTPLLHPLTGVDAAPADRGRRLRRLLLLRAPRRRTSGQMFRPDGAAAHAELEAPADRLPRPRRHGRGLAAPRWCARRASARARRTPAPVFGPSRPARHRGRGRLRRRRPARSWAAGAASATSPSTCSGSCLLNDWSRARHPGLGVRAARPVPRQVLRHVGLAVGRPARRACGGPACLRPARDPSRCPTCATTVPWGLDLALEVRAQRPRRLAAAVRRHVLDGGAAAGAPDRQRRARCAPATCTRSGTVSGPEPRPARARSSS